MPSIGLRPSVRLASILPMDAQVFQHQPIRQRMGAVAFDRTGHPRTRFTQRRTLRFPIPMCDLSPRSPTLDTIGSRNYLLKVD